MADKKKNRKGRKDVDVPIVDQDKPLPIETSVAKFLRKNLPEKKTTLLGHKVDYFVASKAVDALMVSDWAKDVTKNPQFASRDSVCELMEQMLVHKFFHRALKVFVPIGEKKELKTKKAIKGSAGSAKEETDANDTATEATGKKEVKKKAGKKVKLDMHVTQIFVDSNEPYVWIYDPIPLTTWIGGLALVVGAILICLFPLWPRSVRNWVYYLSVAAAGFLFFIIGLALIRFVLFCLVWVVTAGKHHFWMLPNLTEDVGFFASFWPLYHHEYQGSSPPEEDKKSIEDKEEDKGESPSKKEETGQDESDGSDKNGSENGFEIVDDEEIVSNKKDD